jgi:hypothetical protein
MKFCRPQSLLYPLIFIRQLKEAIMMLVPSMGSLNLSVYLMMFDFWRANILFDPHPSLRQVITSKRTGRMFEVKH